MRWPIAPIDSIKADTRYSLVGGPFGSNLTTRDYVEEGVPVIRGNNLSGDASFADDGFVFVSEAKADVLLPNNAHPGDVVFTQRGTLGQVGVIPQESRFPRYIISQSQMKLTVHPEKVDARFVYYYFRHPNTVQMVKNHTLTSGVPHINLEILKGFEIPLPPLPVQHGIVSVLSVYDNLIENNLRRMALREESARLLYREWFVRLRFPGHEHTCIANGVPEGWEKKQLGDVLTLNYGKALKELDRVEGPCPVYGSSGIVGTHDEALVKGPGIIVGRKGNVGSVYWAESDFWPIDTVYFIEASQSSYFLFHNLQHQNFLNSDGAVPGLNRNYAYSSPILLPKPVIREQFEETVTPIYEQVAKLRLMNHKLKAARDLLLPRLMSGEIVV